MIGEQLVWGWPAGDKGDQSASGVVRTELAHGRLDHHHGRAVP